MISVICMADDVWYMISRDYATKKLRKKISEFVLKEHNQKKVW